MKRLGIDIGSTTLKTVLLGENGEILFEKYQRHLSKIPETAVSVLSEIAEKFGDEEMTVCLSGSSGMGVAAKPATTERINAKINVFFNIFISLTPTKYSL